MLQQVINTFRNLPASVKKILGVALFFVIVSAIIRKIWPNPNDWSHISALNIAVPKDFKIYGIDISHHNGQIDWQKVKDFDSDNITIDYVFIKASEGVSLPDKDFKKNWAGARKVGLDHGAYHYYIPWRDPASQFKLFKKQVGNSCGDFPPVLDIEENSLRPDKQIIKEIGEWLQLAENYYGKRPIIYTNQSYFHKFIEGHYDHYPLWIADYSKKELTRYPDKSLHFWQISKKAELDGIEEKVDFNVYLKDKSDLEKL